MSSPSDGVTPWWRYLIPIGIVGAVFAFSRGGSGTGEVQVPERSRGRIPRSEWVPRVVAAVGRFEGGSGANYSAVNPNTDGNGVSFGRIQWTQSSGNLGRLLSRVQAQDPTAGPATFGADWPALLASLTSTDAAVRLGPVGGSVVWASPWIPKWKAFGRLPAVQRVQDSLAFEGPEMAAVLRTLRLLGLTTERAAAIAYDRAVQQGPSGGPSVAALLAGSYAPTPESGRKALARPKTELGVLTEYGWMAASNFRREGDEAPTRHGKHWVWIALNPGSPERSLDVNGQGQPVMGTRTPQGKVWHGVAGTIDLWDDILRRTYTLLTDPNLRDEPIDLGSDQT